MGTSFVGSSTRSFATSSNSTPKTAGGYPIAALCELACGRRRSRDTACPPSSASTTDAPGRSCRRRASVSQSACSMVDSSFRTLRRVEELRGGAQYTAERRLERFSLPARKSPSPPASDFLPTRKSGPYRTDVSLLATKCEGSSASDPRRFLAQKKIGPRPPQRFLAGKKSEAPPVVVACRQGIFEAADDIVGSTQLNGGACRHLGIGPN